MRRPGITSPFARTLLIALAIAPPACAPRPPRAELPRHVAHAMGEIGGHTYTNSLEAWQANYERGCRLFEVDLWITSDRRLVAFHNGMEAAFGLPQGFSRDEFMRTKIYGKYTPLDSDRIARLLAEKPDWKLVTDTKSDFRTSLELPCASLKSRNLSCAERVIPQVYRPRTDLPVAEALGFRQVIFTIYLGRTENREIVRVARSNPAIVAVTMPPARATPETVRSLHDLGIRCYVHTVNGPAIPRQFARGVWGVYTDVGCDDDPRPGG
ncbi:MAG TPA: glycerophosphodiester phosphodiesterase family protein [Thermoanaerobaculia bacterium]|nr:glycerophosphodiester phosphodiesterase family protein [Thermoanaerobaculia bacterium]